LKKYGKIVREKERRKSTGKIKKNKTKKVRGKNTGKRVREKVRKNKSMRNKKYGKIRGKSEGKSQVTSGDVTSGQACAMVRSSGSSTNAN
jgi:hypothetical protein